MKLLLCLKLVLSCVLMLAHPRAVVAQITIDLSSYIKSPADSIHLLLGTPDKISYSETNDAEIWTYYNNSLVENLDPSTINPLDSAIVQISLSSHSLDKERAKAGFIQFAFWNNHVAAVSHIQTGPQAVSFYDDAISYLQKHSNWLGYAAGMNTYRITRLGDNVWTVYRTPEETHIQTIFSAGDAGYMSCSKTDNSAEVKRIKEQFGISLKRKQ